MNEIVSTFLAGDTLMPEMHLRHPVFTYSACGPFLKKGIQLNSIQDGGLAKLYQFFPSNLCNRKN